MEQSKEGTSRVSMYRITNSTHCYTFEANYHGTKHDRRNLHFDPYHNKKIQMNDKRFSLSDMRAMGRSIALSVYDMENRSTPEVLSKMNCGGVTPLHEWVIDRLKRMYSKAHVTLALEDLELVNKAHC
jgi:hypothetical protein